MSVKLVHAVFNSVRVSGNEALVLLAVADLANDDGDNIYPSPEYLAWKSGGMTERTVQSILSRWREIGALQVVGELRIADKGKERAAVIRPLSAATGGRGTRPVYRLDLSKFPVKRAWESDRMGEDVSPIVTAKGCNRKQPKGEGTDGRRVKLEAAEGCKIAQRNKEVEPLVEPSGKPLGGNAKKTPPSVSPNVERISQERVLQAGKKLLAAIGDGPATALARFASSANPRQDLFLRVRCDAKAAALSYAQAKVFLRDHPQWKAWHDLEALDSQQEISFPESCALKLPADLETVNGELCWGGIVEAASRETHRNGFEKWLRPAKAIGVLNGVLFVEVPNSEFKGKLAELDRIFEQEIAGSPISAVRFMTREELRFEFDRY